MVKVWSIIPKNLSHVLGYIQAVLVVHIHAMHGTFSLSLYGGGRGNHLRVPCGLSGT